VEQKKLEKFTASSEAKMSSAALEIMEMSSESLEKKHENPSKSHFVNC